ncbi:MAG TPA: DNA polymerase III subunit gamma/tau C-terminal domain-containing protein, partial [Candidatus Competibacter phosphatis]|nr:DNA polymerase III subunit gamma/tau C-terminal domain-containing protein [Candidatus Competibacter phosphatis]
RQLAQALPPEDVQLFHQIALLGRRDLPLMPEPRGGFEMILLRMLCFRPAAWEVATPVPAETRPVPVPTIAPASRPAPPASEVPAQAIASEWGTLVGQLKLTGIAKQVAMNCALIERQGNDFRLALEPGHAQLFNKSIEDRLKAALEQQLGAPVGLRFQVGGTVEDTPARQRFQQQAERQQVAAERIAQDPHVRDMQKTFGAQIVTVHPLDESEG